MRIELRFKDAPLDLAASLASLVGQPLPADACLDSIDVRGALLGNPGAKGRDHLVQQDNGQSRTFALRAGDWKLHRYDRKRARNVVVEQKLANMEVPQYQLFNLMADPEEKHNVIGENAEVADRLKKLLAGIIQDGRSRP